LAAIKNNDTIKIKKYLNIDEACNYIEYTYDKKEKKWNSMSVLQYAVTQGNINAVRLIIPCCGVNFKNHADETPLHTAARYGKFDIAKYLISQGAEVNATTSLDYDGSTPLIEACVYGHPKTATVLINNGAKVNLATENHGLPLFYTALFGYKDLAKLLIENGAKIDTGSLSPLGAACMAGDTAMISFLINNGANVNYYNGETALMEACEEGKLEAVKLLLNKGADIDQKDCEANAKTANYVHKGETALMMAIKKGHSDIVTYLIEKGANINYLDLLHESPLYKAVDANNFEIAKLLIDKGANVMDTCHGGQTLLMLACVHENIEIIKILISKKIKINVKDEHNKTALTYAREKGSKEIEEFLKQHGAK
jgi:ankyrin repeat protein